MNKLLLLATASCAAALAFTAPAQAAVIDAINLDATPYASSWAANNIGWFYTPTTSYTLTGIGTKFGSYTAAQTVTARIWSGAPGALTLLASGTLTSSANSFADAAFAPLALTAGTTYFFSFGNVSGLSVNVTGDAGATNLAGGLHYDFNAEPGLFNYGPETGVTAQPIVRFLGETAAVPEPASWAMMIGGLGLVGAAMRRRKTVLSFA